MVLTDDTVASLRLLLARRCAVWQSHISFICITKVVLQYIRGHFSTQNLTTAVLEFARHHFACNICYLGQDILGFGPFQCQHLQIYEIHAKGLQWFSTVWITASKPHKYTSSMYACTDVRCLWLRSAHQQHQSILFEHFYQIICITVTKGQETRWWAGKNHWHHYLTVNPGSNCP